MSKPGEALALQAPNRHQAYRTTFRHEGIEILPRAQAGASWRLGVSVMGYGYEGDVRTLEGAEPQARKDRVEYRRGPLTEWYVNRPTGLEQGFELAEPQPRRNAPLVVSMAVHGDLDVSASGDSVSFGDGSGATILRYAGLKAWDAEGRPLRSRMEAAGREVRLLVETEDARFPVTVDPVFVHEAQLFGHGDAFSQPDADFGYSVSIFGDTAAVGARLEDTTGGVNAGAAYVFVRSGTNWIEQQRLVAPDGTAGDEFGYSVAVSGDTLVVGAPPDDAGSAYVFVRSGTIWTEQQKLTASDGVADDTFGISAALDGNTVVLGASSDNSSAGSAYVFVRFGTTWTEQQKLVASDGAAADEFGRGVSIDGDTLVIGAPGDDNAGGQDAGSAFVFVRSGTTWTEQQKLLASDGAAGDVFGHSVSLSGDTVVAGAAASGAMNRGTAYAFVRSGTVWTEEQKLEASDASDGDQFGLSVAVSGDIVVLGAPFDDGSGGQNAGSAYVFVRSGTTWTEQQKLDDYGSGGDFFGYSVAVSGETVVIGAFPDVVPGGNGSAHAYVRSGTTWTYQERLLAFDAGAVDLFGSSVSVSGDTVVIGAPVDDYNQGADRGSAYVLVRAGTTWTEQQKLTSPFTGSGDNFGASVSLSGDTVVVGAPLDNDTQGVNDVGSAYVFVRSGTTWTEQQKLLAADGTAGDLFGISVSISGDTVVVGAYQDSPAGTASGSAYVFVRSGTTWTQQQKLLPTSGAATDYFGYSVALSGDTAVVGAWLADAGGGSIADAGAVYVFVRSGTTWTEQQRLEASDPAASDGLGYAVSVDGDTLVAGSPFDDTPAFETGSAYVLIRSGTTWSEQQKLVASDGGDADQFGASLSIFGDTVAIGALGDDTAAGATAGSAYIFVRSGTTWTEQQKLLAPDAAPVDLFGYSVSISGDTAVIGAQGDDTVDGVDAGSAHVFRGLTTADLGVTKTDGQATAVPGLPLTYTIVVSNAGPGVVTSATVTDMLPAALLGATWSCVASPGSSCTPSGSGNINDTVNLAVGGTATYTVTGTVASGATGALTNAVTVAVPGGVTDPNPANNNAADVDTLTPETDLGVTKTDSADPVPPGAPLTYTLGIANAGPSDATAVTVVDTLPAGVTFVSSNPPSPTCTVAGSTVTCTLGAMAAGSNATVTIDVTVNAGVAGVLVNTATVTGAETDPNPGNNTATETTTIGGAKGELTHGMNIVHDLAAQPGPVADEDRFLISQQPYSSYEVVVDATSGDIGAGAGPLVQRMGPDGTTVLQDSAPVGTGSSRSLRVRNATSTTVADQTVRVRSASCSTDCGPDDTYRIRAYETTYSVPRFNNSGTQVTVLVLQNPTSYPISGDVRFLVPSGTQVAVHSFTLGPKTTLVLNTATVPGANGVSGAITLDHDGRYADLSGKTVALEPATGFSFDSALEPRRK